MDAITSTHHDDAGTFAALLERHRGILLKVAGTYARGADRDEVD